MSLLAELRDIAAAFAVSGTLVSAERHPGGHIHDSYKLTITADGQPATFLLQRINTAIFTKPVEVTENIQRVTAHSAARLQVLGAAECAHRVLTVIATRDGNAYHRTPDGSYWRLYRFIERTRCVETAATPEQAEQAARAFGRFQRLLADWSGPRLHDTIPDFHNTPLRYAALDRAIAEDRSGRASTVRSEIDFAMQHRPLANVLVDLQRGGEIPERIVHNDAKIANILFDAATGEALCVVDLDTVMPGLSLYDFGDMVRSMCCLAAEDETDLSRVEVQPSLFAALARGYLAEAGAFLNAVERDHLLTAGKIITLEQGVRFLTDYLNGDRYYRVARPLHNLDRCRAQLKLLDSLNRNEQLLNQSLAALLKTAAGIGRLATPGPS